MVPGDVLVAPDLIAAANRGALDVLTPGTSSYDVQVSLRASAAAEAAIASVLGYPPRAMTYPAPVGVRWIPELGAGSSAPTLTARVPIRGPVLWAVPADGDVLPSGILAAVPSPPMGVGGILTWNVTAAGVAGVHAPDALRVTYGWKGNHFVAGDLPLGPNGLPPVLASVPTLPAILESAIAAAAVLIVRTSDRAGVRLSEVDIGGLVTRRESLDGIDVAVLRDLKLAASQFIRRNA